MSGTGTHRTGHQAVFTCPVVVVSGKPGDGKSVMVSQIAIEVAKRYGWNSLIFSPEMPVIPQYRARLRRMIGGPAHHADGFIQKHIRFIDHPPSLLSDGKDISVEEIIKRAAEAVMRDDIRLVIVDPWNEVEHARDHAERQRLHRALDPRYAPRRAASQAELDRGGASVDPVLR
jgi:twinkle protein